MHIYRAPRQQEDVNEIGGGNDVAESQRRKEYFAKGADVEYAPCLIQPMQRLQRTPAKAVFAVVIILQNPSARLACPLQQVQTAAQAHRHAGRELVGRGGRDEAGVGAALPPMLN